MSKDWVGLTLNMYLPEGNSHPKRYTVGIVMNSCRGDTFCETPKYVDTHHKTFLSTVFSPAGSLPC